MSDVVLKIDRSNSAEPGITSQTEDQRPDSDQLSLQELDEINGGLPALLIASLLTAYGARVLLGGSRYL
ncbi:hypothetical protein [Methylobacterium nonmethylotrophicum]|uniref:Class IIb bacteriocin, lactobin A/cerein 7B family n=1 Tax=Methylobacterium nonmethylotrophicum TaxID=1141884 RepID=A0A4Z0NLD7_9HYPH|nr:hypothetical protein [Methylobacterium nonmethylotrophicum]TGD96750.1 hypothetical protein EU555_22065 [Methylobacterium nonmethylotrophicum]